MTSIRARLLPRPIDGAEESAALDAAALQVGVERNGSPCAQMHAECFLAGVRAGLGLAWPRLRLARREHGSAHNTLSANGSGRRAGEEPPEVLVVPFASALRATEALGTVTRGEGASADKAVSIRHDGFSFTKERQ